MLSLLLGVEESIESRGRKRKDISVPDDLSTSHIDLEFTTAGSDQLRKDGPNQVPLSFDLLVSHDFFRVVLRHE